MRNKEQENHEVALDMSGVRSLCEQTPRIEKVQRVIKLLLQIGGMKLKLRGNAAEKVAGSESHLSTSTLRFTTLNEQYIRNSLIMIH